VVITKGLKGDESIVRTGQFMLNPGMTVIIVNAAAPSAPGAGT
jgi:hypothetical protein